MAKKIKAIVKLELPAGKATPANPVGPALGAQGINIMQFCKEYNERTAAMAGDVIPAEITVFDDRTFTFILKTPPTAFLLKKAAGVEKGAATPNKAKVGQINRAQLREIAERKMKDLNATTIEAAEKIVLGAARSMGITLAD